MLTKEYIRELKQDNRTELYRFIRSDGNNPSLVFLLENLGRLPADFDGECFIPLLESQNEKIRYLAVKNLGKLGNDRYLPVVSEIAQTENNTMVRREAVSCIGRMHSRKAIPFLVQMLSDSDPKVVLQAIRALLVFNHNSNVAAELKKLKDHPNEMVQYVIRKEFFPEKQTQRKTQKHTESPEYMRNVIVHGDVLEIIKNVPDFSVHLTFTSPPYYNARDYSIYQSYQQYLDFLTDVFREVHRITKEGRFFILNTSPIIIPRVSRQHASKRYPIPFDIHHYLIEMGWEFIDDIIWIKPEASVKNRNAGFLQHRKPLGYKPNPVTEYVMVYRKKTDKLLDWNIHQYGRNIVEESKVDGDYETSNAWEIDPVFDRVHSAVFPIELCNKIVKYYSYIGDLLFDPFAGRGTFGKAAMDLDRFFFLTEIEKKYIEKIRNEIVHHSVFVEKTPKIIDAETFKNIAKEVNHDA